MRLKTVRKDCETYTAEIYMAGDICLCKNVLQKMAASEGMCVSVEKVDYIYTGGMESGFVVRVINYPRFPTTEREIRKLSVNLAESLLYELGQGSYTIVYPDETVFMSRRDKDER